MSEHTSDVALLQDNLLRLMHGVQQRGYERPSLRAEVLLSMNVLCSGALLLSVWQMLEAVNTRQEMLLVRLLVDLEPAGVEAACEQLIGSEDLDERSVGHAVLALHATPSATARLIRAFAREPGAVLKRSGRRHLAPYSFVTGMLAGIREFKEPHLDRVAMVALEAHAEGRAGIDLLEEMLGDDDPQVAQLGFVALGSRVMGRIHRAAYEHVICREQEHLLDAEGRAWLQRALTLAPEVIEVIGDRGPDGLAGPRFVRARAAALRAVGDAWLAQLCAALLEGERPLPSLRIESALYPTSGVDAPSRRKLRSRALAYLLAILLEFRPGLAALVEGLESGEELEIEAIERTFLIGGDRAALNAATAIIGHWCELEPGDAEQGPFWRWLDGLWRDDRYLCLDQAVAEALRRPDETSVYAARVLSVVGDALGRALRRVVEGEAVRCDALLRALEDPRWRPALYAQLRGSSVVLHSQTIVALARLGHGALLPALLERRQSCREESPGRAALDYAIRLLEARRALASEETVAILSTLGMRDLDARFERAEHARERLEALGDHHPMWRALEGCGEGGGVLQVFFWPPRGPVAIDGEERDFVLCAEAVIDLEGGACHYLRWLNARMKPRMAPPLLRPAPGVLRRGFMGLPWGFDQGEAEAVLADHSGELLAIVPREGRRARARVAALVHGERVRLEFDRRRRFFRGLQPVAGCARIDEAIQQARQRMGTPVYQSPHEALWCFEELEVLLREEPGIGALVERVTLRERASD